MPVPTWLRLRVQGTWTLSALNTWATCSPLLVKTYNIPQREPSTYYAPDTVLREEL